MVTIEFKSFQAMKDTIAIATISPENFKPYKFHTTFTVAPLGDVKRASCLLAGGRVVLIYDFAQAEDVTAASDEWFNDSVEVLAVGENIT